LTRIIAISNQKGGVGKTSTTLNLGACLAGKGKRVLLIDLDPQAHLSIKKDIWLEGIDALSFIKGEKELKSNGRDFNLIHSDLTLSEFDSEFSNKLGRDQYLQRAIRKSEDEISKYNFVLIDTPPNLGVLTTNTLSACNEVIVPVQTLEFAKQGLEIFLDMFKSVKEILNPNIKSWNILPTMVDFRRRQDKEILEELRKEFKEHVFNTFIRTNSKVAESPRAQTDVLSYAKNRAEDYINLAGEVLKNG